MSEKVDNPHLGSQQRLGSQQHLGIALQQVTRQA